MKSKEVAKRKSAAPTCSQPAPPQPSSQYVRKESTGRKEGKEKKNSVDMSGRRQSMTAQITRQARRLSAAIAPQLTKVELPMLMKIPGVIIQARDHVQIETVMQNYILHNTHNFEPVDFLVQDLNKSVVLTAQVGASHAAFYECGRKVVELSFGDAGDRSNLVAKIKHPVSGMVVNELVDFDDCIVVYNNTEHAGARIEVQSSSWMALLARCGCTFAPERWNILVREQKIAEVSPVTALLQESSIEVAWENFCEMDMRMVSMCFGLLQLVRKAYPPLITIINEHRNS